MSHALRDDAPRCSECGAPLDSDADKCWLCQGKRHKENFAVSPSSVPERKPAGQFSLASVFLIITLIAICLRTLRLAPGLGVLLIVVTIPALIRTCVVGVHKKRVGYSLSMGEKLVAFLASSLLIILVGVAGFVAFEIACWGSCAMVAGIQQQESENAMLIGIGTGCVAGLGVMLWLLWRTWPRNKG